MAIKNGKVYGSKASAYVVNIRPERKIWNDGGTILLDTVPAIRAEFAYHAGEFRFHNPLTGSMDIGADIRGHQFHSSQQAEEKGWTQEEHDMVVSVLDRLCQRDPEHIWELTTAKSPAPWPTYDSTHHNQVAPLAEQLGLVAEALAYEQENEKRPSVVEKLQALLATDGEVEELTAA